MENNKTTITIETLVTAPISKVWECWTEPADIMNWNAASDDWHAPRAENDLRVGGTFTCRMEAKDGSFGFDFGGTYADVVPQKHIAYTLGDGRKVDITFEEQGDQVHITEFFEAESTNPIEKQKDGWQSILNNFKKYVEAK